MTKNIFGRIIQALIERKDMSQIQYLESQQIGNTKVTLWRTGNYRYQIETKTETNTEVFNFEAEYNQAVCEFIQKAREINNKMA